MNEGEESSPSERKRVRATSALLREVFDPLIGEPAWDVRKGLGSFLTMEFGEPRKEVTEWKGEPKRRSVSIWGDYGLWIYMCNWEMRDRQQFIAHCESSDRRIHRAARIIGGQSLSTLWLQPDATTVFQFDLGASLRCWRYHDWEDEEIDELWSLRIGETYHCLTADGWLWSTE